MNKRSAPAVQILCLVSALLLCLGAAAASAQVAGPAPQTIPSDPAVTPSDRMGEGWWAARHNALLATLAAHPDPKVLLIGDSITNNYDKANPPDENFQPTWRQFYAPRGALNLGFSGDTTSNVLWRLQHGEVQGLHPKVVILLIGTNDTGAAGRTAAQTERGIDAVLGELELRLPDTKILLLGLLPSDISPAKTAADKAVNQYLATCYGENPRVTYLDIGSVFYKADGALNTDIYYDPRLPQPLKPLHPDTVGQHRMAEAIEPTLAKMLGEAPLAPLAFMTDINTALIPVPRLEADSYDWYARHHAELAFAAQVKPKFVMIGDSITHFWGGSPDARRISGPLAWRRLVGDAPVINLGFGWDRTQNVLWRLRQGEFQGLSPKWVVINIGTNNFVETDNARANTPAEVAEGVEAIVSAVHERSPASRILLMGIFPRGAAAIHPLRIPIYQTNRLLAARYAKDRTVTFLDIAASFVDPTGDMVSGLMPDQTHPTEAGYALWTDALIRAGVRP